MNDFKQFDCWTYEHSLRYMNYYAITQDTERAEDSTIKIGQKAHTDIYGRPNLQYVLYMQTTVCDK